MKYLFIATLILILNGCYTVGHQDYVNWEDSRIGTKAYYIKPYKFTHTNPGEFTRGNFEIAGYGLTHVTKDIDGNLITHWDDGEILPNYANGEVELFSVKLKTGRKEWVGKCLTYYVIDAKTHIIKSWGFDKGGNPLSCRTWQ